MVKNSTKKSTTTTKLVRNSQDKVFGGVASGLADFFQIDVTIVRIIFVLLTIFGGGGLIIYFVLWLIIPTKKNAGKISENTIREGADEMKQTAEKYTEDFRRKDRRSNSRSIFGLILLAVGLIILFDNFGFVRFFNIYKLWPLILIFLSFMILTKKDEK